MIRNEKKYPVNFIFSNIIEGNLKQKFRRDMDGDLINMGSDRYKVFQRSCICVECGIEGTYFLKEKHISKEPYHFNLYGVNDDGQEILMTKDHIIPKSQGGKNHLDNYQTMCTKCNAMKGTK